MFASAVRFSGPARRERQVALRVLGEAAIGEREPDQALCNRPWVPGHRGPCAGKSHFRGCGIAARNSSPAPEWRHTDDHPAACPRGFLKTAALSADCMTDLWARHTIQGGDWQSAVAESLLQSPSAWGFDSHRGSHDALSAWHHPPPSFGWLCQNGQECSGIHRSR